MNRDFIFGLIALGLAVGYYVMAADIQATQLADEVGADGLPRVYAYALGALGLALTLFNLPRRAVVIAAANDNAAPRSYDLRQLRRALGVLAIGIGYVLLAPWIGYIPGIALVIIGIAVYQGATLDWKLILTGVVGALFLWFVFVVLLHIRQPSGLWSTLGPALGL